MGKISDLYLNLFESMPSFYSAEMIKVFHSISGPGELMHPSIWSRYMSYAEGWAISGWGEKDGIARLQLKFDAEEMEKLFQGEDLPMDLKSMEGMELNIFVSSDTGAILDWQMAMIEIPLSLSPNQGDPMGTMTMKMEMRTVPVMQNAPTIVMPAEGVMDLNPYFDEFLPLIEIGMQMAVEEMEKQQGDRESTDDFEF